MFEQLLKINERKVPGRQTLTIHDRVNHKQNNYHFDQSCQGKILQFYQINDSHLVQAFLFIFQSPSINQAKSKPEPIKQENRIKVFVQKDNHIKVR